MDTMDTKEELDNLRKEIRTVLDPLEKRAHELNRLIEEEFIEQQKAQFKQIEGKLFYGDKDSWSGFKDTIMLIKVISCDDWSTYNSCKILKFELTFSKGKFYSISIAEDTNRVSNFDTHYTELTPELFMTISKLANTEILNSLSNFKL